MPSESSLDRRSERLQDRLDASRAWAEENDVELPLSPGHAAGSGRMGPTTVVQDVPPLLMIEYGVEGVECVTPHRAGRDEHSIEDRLDALARYDVDDLPIEESFDRLTDLIASHFDVGVAFIGLIERDEENFLACHGADWDRLTREQTICTHSMLQEDVMVVEDIANDARFNRNPQLENLGIVSYAGANMTTDDGHVVGQLCLIDFERRSYSADEKRDLQQFAATAMEILELRQQLRESQRTEVAQ